MTKMGAFEISHIDEFIDLLLNEVRFKFFWIPHVGTILRDSFKNTFFRIVSVKLFYPDYKNDLY